MCSELASGSFCSQPVAIVVYLVERPNLQRHIGSGRRKAERPDVGATYKPAAKGRANDLNPPSFPLSPSSLLPPSFLLLLL